VDTINYNPHKNSPLFFYDLLPHVSDIILALF
jgi:hypothetical protein